MRPIARPVLLLATALLLVAGCAGSSGQTPTAAPVAATPTAADAAFVRHMLPHHVRALQVGALMSDKGSDPRVKAFGRRILSEQNPERQRLASWVGPVGARPSSTDATTADGYVTDAEYARLMHETGRTFDRDALLLSARSETGAATMAQAELAGGSYGPARQLATSISGAPGGEIPELQRLAAAVG